MTYKIGLTARWMSLNKQGFWYWHPVLEFGVWRYSSNHGKALGYVKLKKLFKNKYQIKDPKMKPRYMSQN